MTISQFNKAVFKQQIEDANFDYDAPLFVLGFDKDDHGFAVLRNRERKDFIQLLQDVLRNYLLIKDD